MHVCVFYLLRRTLIFTVTPAFNLVIGYELSKLGGHFERRVILGSTYYFLSIFSSPLKLNVIVIATIGFKSTIYILTAPRLTYR